MSELSCQEVASLLSLAKDEAGNSTRNRKRPSWRFYSARMLTHSHSDGEFPLYSQGKKAYRKETNLPKKKNNNEIKIHQFFA